MPTFTTKDRALAIAAGCAFTAGGLTILLGPALTKPMEWTSFHVLTILTVFGTIAAGHLMVDAGRAKHVFAMLGFLALFLAGTGLVVYKSVGRQAETADTKALSAEATNTAIADKRFDLEKARARLDDATKAADREMTGEKCGSRCKDWRLRATEVSSHIKSLESEIAALGPQKPVNAEASKMADMLALFGVNRDKAVALFSLLEPFLNTLFFEIGSIVSLGFAFRARSIATVAKSPEETFAETKAKAIQSIAERSPLASMFSGELPDPTPPKPRKRASTRLPDNVVPFAGHPVVEALRANGGAVSSNRRLAQLMGVCEPESSKRVREVLDKVAVERIGKRVHIRLIA